MVEAQEHSNATTRSGLVTSQNNKKKKKKKEDMAAGSSHLARYREDEVEKNALTLIMTWWKLKNIECTNENSAELHRDLCNKKRKKIG